MIFDFFKRNYAQKRFESSIQMSLLFKREIGCESGSPVGVLSPGVPSPEVHGSPLGPGVPAHYESHDPYSAGFCIALYWYYNGTGDNRVCPREIESFRHNQYRCIKLHNYKDWRLILILVMKYDRITENVAA